MLSFTGFHPDPEVKKDCHLFMKVFWAFVNCLLRLRRPVHNGPEWCGAKVPLNCSEFGFSSLSQAFLKLPWCWQCINDIGLSLWDVVSSRATSPSLRCFGPPLRLGDSEGKASECSEVSEFRRDRRVSGGWSRSSGSLGAKITAVCSLTGRSDGHVEDLSHLLVLAQRVYWKDSNRCRWKNPLFVAFRRVSE